MLVLNMGVYKAIAGAFIGVCLITIIALTYNHYSGLVESNAALTSEVATLKQDLTASQAAVDAYEKAIDSWKQAAEVQASALDQFAQAQHQAGSYSKELKNVFSKHDLGALAKAKPGLVERALNSGTLNAFRLLELSSQSPLPGSGFSPGTSITSPASAKSDPD